MACKHEILRFAQNDKLKTCFVLSGYPENGVSTHTADGEYYYGSDIGVDPVYQGRGIARQLYNHRKALVRR